MRTLTIRPYKGRPANTHYKPHSFRAPDHNFRDPVDELLPSNPNEQHVYDSAIGCFVLVNPPNRPEPCPIEQGGDVYLIKDADQKHVLDRFRATSDHYATEYFYWWNRNRNNSSGQIRLIKPVRTS
jgi:hypothetical protein